VTNPFIDVFDPDPQDMLLDFRSKTFGGTLDDYQRVKTKKKPKGVLKLVGQRTLYRWSGRADQPAVIFQSQKLELDDDGGLDSYHPPTPAHKTGKPPGRDYLANASSTTKIAYNPNDPDKLINGLPWDHVNNTPWCGIVVNPATHRPYIQGPSDPHPGFYVPRTALSDPTLPESDPKHGVDASTIPFLVLYKQVAKLGIKQGDYAAVVIKEAAGIRVLYAIIADAKGFGHGEGSRALLRDILNLEPTGSVERTDMTFILFPHSAAEPPWRSSYGIEDVQQRARRLFLRWGGLPEFKIFVDAMKYML
jgi:hypothetical protein